MSNIDFSSILKKVDTWTTTDEGKKRIREKLKEYRETGVSKTEGGSKIVTLKDMNNAAEQMIHILKEIASRHKLPTSVLEHFDSLKHTEPKEHGDGYEVSIFFLDDMSRPSLTIARGKNKGKRTGDGVSNIVALFDTGYGEDEPVKKVFGIWEGHEELGSIGNLRVREEIGFMQEAIDEFNRRFGDLYDVYADVDPSFYENRNNN